MDKYPEWVHIIGIAGVTTSGIAAMFKDNDSRVTGSDKGFFPPVSTYLAENGIAIQAGYKAERLSDKGRHPDLVVIQGTKSDDNPELTEARKFNLQILTYPEVLQKYVIKPDASIVVAGTYGKTTITAALVKIFNQASIKTSYMIGGVSSDFPRSVIAKTDDTKYSLIEGDEYLISQTDNRSKFFLYSPKYLILNSAEWEHPDLFANEEVYLDNFKELVKLLPEDGLLVANGTSKNVIAISKVAKCKVIYYAQSQTKAETDNDWYINSLSKPLPTMIKPPNEGPAEIIPYEKQLIGDFNEENLLAAAALAYELGIKKERIQEAIREFKGVKRRLEIRFENKNVIVVDDFGSSPPKAKGSLAALRKDFFNGYIIAVFEPNSGNRVEAALKLYDDAFKDADEVVLPEFTRLPKIKQKRFAAEELATYLQKKTRITFISDDDNLVAYLKEKTESENSKEKVIICFLGSHSFRGMIAALVSNLS